MYVPLELVLVRHGESEGNVANRASRSGDHSHFTDSFRAGPSRNWHLTRNGKSQGRKAGEWLKAEGMDEEYFDFCTASSYTRAIETAIFLGFNNTNWGALEIVRERDWGLLDIMPQHEREIAFNGHFLERDKDPINWTPPGGESLAHVVERVKRFFSLLHVWSKRHDRVVCVCHGEIMWAFRLLLEDISHEDYIRLHYSDEPEHNISNGHVLHYRRQPSEVKYSQMRSVCTYNPDRSDVSWQSLLPLRKCA